MQYKKEYILALIGRFVPMFIYLGTTMVLARFLSPYDFGMIGVLAIFFNVAKTLMDAGLGGSLVKEKHLESIDCSTIFVFNVAISSVLYIFLFFCSGIIEQYFETPGLSSIVKILCSVFIIDSFGLVPLSLLTRKLDFKAITIINISSVICASAVSIVLAVFGVRVYSLIAYQIIAAFVTVALSFYYSKFHISFRFSKSSFQRLISFGIYTTLTSLLDSIYENLITFLFGKYLNMQHAGYLSQAKRLEEVPSQSVVQTISNVAFPVLTKIRDNSNRFAEECYSTFKIILLLLLPLLFSISIFSEPIIILVFGHKWIPAAPYLSLLMFAAVFHVAETLNRTFIKSTTKVKPLFVFTSVKRAIGIVIIIVFVYIEPMYSLYGYIISTLIGYLFNAYLLFKVSELSVLSQFGLFVQTLIPSIAYFILMSFIIGFGLSMPLNIIAALLLLSIYYLFVLRLYDIDIISYCKSLLVKMFKKYDC